MKNTSDIIRIIQVNIHGTQGQSCVKFYISNTTILGGSDINVIRE